MKRALLVTSLTLAGMLLVTLRPAQSSPVSTEDQIAKLEQDWLAAEATGDMAALRHLIADDFIGTGPGGNVLSKGDIVPESSDGARIPKSSVRDSTVRVFGDTAVFMGYVEQDGSKPPEGFHVTNVYQKRPQGWQMIATHMSR